MAVVTVLNENRFDVLFESGDGRVFDGTERTALEESEKNETEPCDFQGTSLLAITQPASHAGSGLRINPPLALCNAGFSRISFAKTAGQPPVR